MSGRAGATSLKRNRTLENGRVQLKTSVQNAVSVRRGPRPTTVNPYVCDTCTATSGEGRVCKSSAPGARTQHESQTIKCFGDVHSWH